ncbi:MAG TPA: hypothetical protein VN613_10285, partial [Gemmatimonadaceae bacterium]|nr:hypothetical protein [Gemmatimonadaceae bacterium]
GQEEGWKEEGREEEVGFLTQRGKSAQAGFPLCFLTAIEDRRWRINVESTEARRLLESPGFHLRSSIAVRSGRDH